MIERIKKLNNKITIAFGAMYSIFLIFMIVDSLWMFLKPGYVSTRLEAIYYHPELIFLFILFCSIFSYPLIVIGSLYKILTKIENLEKKI